MGQKDTQKQLIVFLSHASEDKKQTRSLFKRLKDDGFDPWLDEERLLPGQDWNLEIEKALRASDAILLCFSTLSIGKEGYIQREYKRAMNYLEEKPEGTIYAIPVRFDDCELPMSVQKLHWVDYPADYDRLVKSLQMRAGGSAIPKKSTKPKTQKPASRRTTNKLVGGNMENGIHIGGNVSGSNIIMGNNNVVNAEEKKTK